MKRMNDDMKTLKKETAKMGGLSLKVLEDVADAMYNNADVTEDVKKMYSSVRNMDADIEGKAIRILMLYQPVSGDMRFVAMVLKMITYLERIGKYGYNISKTIRDMRSDTDQEIFAILCEMRNTATEMLKMAVDALENGRDIPLTEYEGMEEALDIKRKDVLNAALISMSSSPGSIENLNRCISLSRYFERIGDHVCKLAEKQHFAVTGEYMH